MEKGLEDTCLETKGSLAAPERPWRRPGVFPEDDEAVPCADGTSDIFILCCFHFMCNQDSTKTGKEGAPRILQQACEMCPSLLAGCGRAWMMRSLSSLARWTEHCLESLVLLMKAAPCSSVLPGLDDCSPRACLFLLN